jgi:hypothetical protein
VNRSLSLFLSTPNYALGFASVWAKNIFKKGKYFDISEASSSFFNLKKQVR